VSLVTKCVTGDFLQLTFNDVGRGGGVKKCFLSLRLTALLSAEGKKAFQKTTTVISALKQTNPKKK
jgi:hypothetical protein